VAVVTDLNYQIDEAVEEAWAETVVPEIVFER
jgi:hypothetical protein